MPSTHAFVSTLPDDPDVTLIRPSNWNSQHVLSIATSEIQNESVTIDKIQSQKSRSTGFEDFISASNGELTTTVIGAGTTATNNFPIANANQIGIRVIETGTTTTGAAAVRTASDSLRLGNGEAVFHTSILIPVLSSVAEEFIIRVGFLDNFTGDQVDGVYFEYDRLSDTNWRVATSSNSVRTKNATINLVDTNYHTLMLKVNSLATSASFFIDGLEVTGSPITTNIPTGVGRETGFADNIVKSAGTTTRSARLDWISWDINLTTGRV